MHPIIFEIGGFPLRSFGLMVVLGFLLGSHFFTKWGLRGHTDSPELRARLDALPMWVLGGVVGGARLMYVVVEVLRGGPVGQGFLDDPLSMLYVWEGGLVMYGGAFGGLLGGWWAAKKHDLGIGNAIDIGTVCAFAGLAVGRIGCLLVGDDYGSEVPENLRSLPFPITITVPEELKEGSLFGNANRGKVLWGTQMWMSINAALTAMIGYYWLRRRRYYGQVALRLMAIYAIARYVIEMFRGDAIRGVWFNGAVSTSQLISVLTFVVCVVVLWRWRGKEQEGVALPPAGGPAS